ncbi:MAG: type II toxin-antitoxin system mRNA interferase toxin, RelE/StbE family [SAR324 cluster bacterium]|nr:type II toxin-antitoxin system mRNA interferase toxin, RelE/StbE family [SAR324 cluster bacterium]
MIELVWDESLLRTLKKWRKKHPDLLLRFADRIELFSNEPFHPFLKTHTLSGNLEGYHAFSITYEYRMVFKFISDTKVLLVDIGTHDEVY